MSITVKGQALEAGCYVDGHWGRWGMVRQLDITDEMLFDDGSENAEAFFPQLPMREVESESIGSPYKMVDDDSEDFLDILVSLSDEATDKLNAVTEGGSWGWEDGEYYLMEGCSSCGGYVDADEPLSITPDEGEPYCAECAETIGVANLIAFLTGINWANKGTSEVEPHFPRSAPTHTQRVLYGMLTENTGTHFLDSGSAYGRNWQRMQGQSVESLMLSPVITFDTFGCLGLDVFHFLSERLEAPSKGSALARMWERFIEWDDAHTYEDGEGWLSQADRFPAWITAVTGWEMGWEHDWINTYNNEDALSQVIQYRTLKVEVADIYSERDIDFPEYEYVTILQIHGGCDVRGGYTAPKVFWLTDTEGYGLGDNAKFEGQLIPPTGTEPQSETLPGMPEAPTYEPQYVTTYNGGYSWEIDSYEARYDSLKFVEVERDELPAEDEREPRTAYALTDSEAVVREHDSVTIPLSDGGTLAIYPPYIG